MFDLDYVWRLSLTINGVVYAEAQGSPLEMYTTLGGKKQFFPNDASEQRTSILQEFQKFWLIFPSLEYAHKLFCLEKLSLHGSWINNVDLNAAFITCTFGPPIKEDPRQALQEKPKEDVLLVDPNSRERYWRFSQDNQTIDISYKSVENIVSNHFNGKFVDFYLQVISHPSSLNSFTEMNFLDTESLKVEWVDISSIGLVHPDDLV